MSDCLEQDAIHFAGHLLNQGLKESSIGLKWHYMGPFYKTVIIKTNVSVYL